MKLKFEPSNTSKLNLDKYIFEGRFILFIVSILSFLGFPLVYNFLYGYYFAGTDEIIISIFQAYSNLVSFDLQLYSVISVFFIGNYYILNSLLRTLLGNKRSAQQKIKSVLIISILFTALFSIIFAIFFGGEISPEKVVSFFLLFVSILFFIGLLGSIGYIISVQINRTCVNFQIILGYMYIVVYMIKLFHFGEIFWLISLSMLIYYLAIISSAINNFIIEKAHLFTISWSMVTVTYFNFLNQESPIFFCIFYFTSMLIFILILYKLYVLKIHQMDNQLIILQFQDHVNYVTVEKMVSTNSEIIKHGLIMYLFKHLQLYFFEKNNNSKKISISITAIVAFLLTPQIALMCGYGVRVMNDVSSEHKYEITLNTVKETKVRIKANYYIISGNEIIYSDENWKLARIKSDNYIINEK